MAFCKNCGARLEEGAQFCPSCGAKVREAPPPKSFCTHCGAELTPGARFCKKCGAAADSAAPAQPARTVEVSPGASRAAYAHQKVKTTYASERARQAEQAAYAQAPAEAPKRKGYGFVTFLLLLICAGLIYLAVTRGLPNIREGKPVIGGTEAFVIRDQDELPETEPADNLTAPAAQDENPDHPTLYFGGSEAN